MKVALRILPRDVMIQGRIGEPLIKPIQRAGLPIGYACRGQGICTACSVWVDGAVSEQTAQELSLLKGAHHLDGFQRRIGCLVKIRGPVAIRTDYW